MHNLGKLKRMFNTKAVTLNESKIIIKKFKLTEGHIKKTYNIGVFEKLTYSCLKS